MQKTGGASVFLAIVLSPRTVWHDRAIPQICPIVILQGEKLPKTCFFTHMKSRLACFIDENKMARIFLWFFEIPWGSFVGIPQ